MVTDEKKKLEREAENMHRGTKASTRFLEKTHLSLRDKHSWYRKWHSMRFANIFHIFVALVIFSWFSYYFYGIYSDISYANKLPKINAVYVGNINGNDLRAGVFHKSNIKVNEDNSIEIEDNSVKIGFIKYRAYTDDLAEWKNVSWSSNVPKDASIVYRIRTTKNSNDDLEDVPWSDYYTVSGHSITSKGIPNIKSRILEAEIIIQADGGPSPQLKYLSFGYTPFDENEFLIKVRDGFFSWIKNALDFISRREGIYSK
jgi:hypothetical protein